MPTPLYELEAQVLGLKPAERARLLDRLVESFEPDTEAEKAQVTEALRRESDVRIGNSRMVPALKPWNESGRELDELLALRRSRARTG